MTGDNSKSAELKLSLVVARREKTPDSSQVLEVNSFTSGIWGDKWKVQLI